MQWICQICWLSYLLQQDRSKPCTSILTPIPSFYHLKSLCACNEQNASTLFWLSLNSNLHSHLWVWCGCKAKYCVITLLYVPSGSDGSSVERFLVSLDLTYLWPCLLATLTNALPRFTATIVHILCCDIQVIIIFSKLDDGVFVCILDLISYYSRLEATIHCHMHMWYVNRYAWLHLSWL